MLRISSPGRAFVIGALSRACSRGPALDAGEIVTTIRRTAEIAGVMTNALGCRGPLASVVRIRMPD
jgi:Ni,Fe-hydrogenase I small subunit